MLRNCEYENIFQDLGIPVSVINIIGNFMERKKYKFHKELTKKLPDIINKENGEIYPDICDRTNFIKPLEKCRYMCDFCGYRPEFPQSHLEYDCSCVYLNRKYNIECDEEGEHKIISKKKKINFLNMEILYNTGWRDFKRKMDKIAGYDENTKTYKFIESLMIDGWEVGSSDSDDSESSGDEEHTLISRDSDSESESDDSSDDE